MLSRAVIAFLAAIPLAVAAQDLGTFKSVDGIVTVTEGTGGSTASSGGTFRAGQHIVTTPGSSVTLDFGNGCTVTLQPNQSVTLNSASNCNNIVVQRVVPGGGPNFAAGPGFTGGAGGAVGAMVLLGGYAIGRRVLLNDPVSPN
jgi:hypothetical protein